MRLVALGTNGFFPGNNRHTASYLLLPTPKIAILLDAGTGVARLIEPSVAVHLVTVKELHIVLSHYHLDHVSGLFYLTGAWPGRKVILYAPGKPLIEANGEKAIKQLLGAPFYPLPTLPLEIRPITSQEVLVADLKFQLRSQRHPGGSIGIRIEDYLSYITDTVADPETVTFVRGSKLLLHEVWLNDEEANSSIEADGVPAREKHSWAGAVARIAATAKVGMLAPIHHPPWRTDEQVDMLIQNLKRISGVPALRLAEGAIYDV